MKKHIYFTLLFLATVACKAQSPVYNIDEPHSERTPGSYFKDLNGELDGYDGTYLYTNGNTSLKIILMKKIKSYGYYYEDLVVGEFQFIKNGVELNNTLANINVNYTDEEINHIIKGHRILTGTVYGCRDCSPTEKRLRLSFIDNKSDATAGLDIRKTTVDGKVAIKVNIFPTTGIVTQKVGDPVPVQRQPSIELGDI